MLKLRILTAGVLLPVVLGATFGLDRIPFALVAACFFLAAAWEWSGMLPVRAAGVRLAWVVATLVLMALAEWQQPAWLLAWLPLWWLGALMAVVAWPAGGGLWFRAPVLMLVGWLLVIPSWQAVVQVQSSGAFGLAGPWALLFILCWVWAADTGAYFAGRAFGRHSLAPNVSPGKTLEGLTGGLVLALAVAAVVAWQAPVAPEARGPILLVTLVTVLASVLGDLFESLIKRRAGVKDSGTMLPGHGGMLDRIDSITAALPVAVMLVGWLALPGGPG